MANSNITHRQVSTSESSPFMEDHERKNPMTKPKVSININIDFSCPFNIPSTAEAAAFRVLRNLSCFMPYYVLFIGVVLLITLIPARGFSLFLLAVNTNFCVMHMLLLRAFPSSKLLHRWIDKRLVLASLAVATAVEMIVTDAGRHLLFTLVGTIPVILIHALVQGTKTSHVTADQADEGVSDYILDAV